MLRIVAYDMAGGYDRKVIAEAESFQVTGTDVRTDDDIVVLHLDIEFCEWRDSDGLAWFDWTVENV